jgi:aromatic-L-amino-acid/L-tryptophan decarboxylase
MISDTTQVATVGTTSSGAVDRIDEIGEVCASFIRFSLSFSHSSFQVRENPNIWLHVDAAWAGVTLACPEFREQAYLSAINEYATSFCTNFHKVCNQTITSYDYQLNSIQWGLVNFDASTLWVRDRKNLTDALDVTPEFLRTKQGDEGTYHFFDPSVQFTNISV